ncbi:MAG: hypothetical protein JO323_15270 [Acidobacteriia bacterium]|nr:hypothetical protein [Terriglobia bacterium]
MPFGCKFKQPGFHDQSGVLDPEPVDAALGIIVKTPTLRINPVRIAPVTLRCSIPYWWQVSRISKLAALN